MIFTLMCFVMLMLSLVIQDFIPGIAWAYHSYLHLVSVVFFAIAISVPFPVMLLFAFVTGFVWDFKTVVDMPQPEIVEAAVRLQVAAPKIGATFGISIFFFGLLGALMQGIRPLFRKGRWEMPVLMCGIGTFLLLTFEYLWINFRRGGFYFPSQIWHSILTTAALSTLVAPFLFLLIDRMARLGGYHIRYEGLANRRWQS